jgi:hypothetical protein
VFNLLFCLFLIIIWCDLFAAMVCVIPVCLHAYVSFHLSAINSNDNECTEEGEVFDYQGEDQGQADQGKPSILDTYLILFTYFACFIKVY